MKKIINKLKKIFMGISSFLILLPIKVQAMKMIQPLYGPPPELSEPQKTTKSISVIKFILTYFRLICIPVFLVVGLVIYLKKRDAKRGKKIIIFTVTISIYIFIWLCFPIILNKLFIG